ncbi:MAG: class I SAM-dependent methyltransferase [Burkholderiales bacterium]|nr:class I SAM-dependent methyltransferase [Burkholderiales bacterium]
MNMNRAKELFRNGQTLEAMNHIVRSCFEERSALPRKVWRDDVAASARDPEILNYVHRCRMTRRAFEKPRGYGCDAVTLDLVYGTGEGRNAPHPATQAGQVYSYTVNSPAPRAVRFRRQTLARLIDETVARTGDGRAQIVSIACGHAREVELSRAMQARRAGGFLAIDQDVESIAVVESEYGPFGVEARHGTVRQIVGDLLPLPPADLIYAAGLYEYLNDSTAIELLQRMVDALKPGGRVMIANFVPDVPDAGYMEAFMDCWLEYRDLTQLVSLFDPIPASSRGPIETLFDPDCNIAFAVMQKPE